MSNEEVFDLFEKEVLPSKYGKTALQGQLKNRLAHGLIFPPEEEIKLGSDYHEFKSKTFTRRQQRYTRDIWLIEDQEDFKIKKKKTIKFTNTGQRHSLVEKNH